MRNSFNYTQNGRNYSLTPLKLGRWRRVRVDHIEQLHLDQHLAAVSLVAEPAAFAKSR
jgi:hypothetical protein